jgi:hypothetical protein
MELLLKRQVAHLLIDLCPNGGRLRKPVSAHQIVEMLAKDHIPADHESVVNILLEFGAVGYVWLARPVRREREVSVAAIFYPYGLALIA